MPNNVAKRSNSIAVSVISETPDIDSKGEWHLVDRRDGQVIILDLSQCAFIDSMGVTVLGNVSFDFSSTISLMFCVSCIIQGGSYVRWNVTGGKIAFFNLIIHDFTTIRDNEQRN